MPHGFEAAPPTHRERWGVLAGFTMAFGASLSFVAARSAILDGIGAADLIFARFLVAGAIMLPFLLRWGLPGLAGIGLRRSLVLMLTGGPLFALLQTGGYAFAPLAHGAVIAPSTVTILSTIGAALFLGERLGRAHIAGAALVLLGIGLLGWDSLSRSAAAADRHAWIGDLMFFVSSMLLASFTLLLRHWRVPAVRAAAVVCVLSCAITTPVYLLWAGTAHLASLPLEAVAFQGLVQGGLQGLITMIAFSQAILLLGVRRAVLFPAIVPAISVLLGIPLVGEIPDTLQLAGLGLVTIGLLTVIGITGRLLTWRRKKRTGSA
jgi:drug/metabolite transporter (DMT)-like permease